MNDWTKLLSARLQCPDCGAAIKWSESSAKPGAKGRAECLRQRQMFAINDCSFRGHVIRQADGSVLLERDEPKIDRILDRMEAWFSSKYK